MKWISALMLSFLFPVASVAQDAQAITFGVVDLRLGMMQDQALASLSKYYALTPVNSSLGQGVFWIFPRGSRTEDLEKNIGSVTFKDARLMAVTKKWVANPVNANDLALTLYGLVRELEAKTDTICRLGTTEQVFAGGGDTRTVGISCGRQRKIRVELFSGRQTFVYEELAEP